MTAGRINQIHTPMGLIDHGANTPGRVALERGTRPLPLTERLSFSSSNHTTDRHTLVVGSPCGLCGQASQARRSHTSQLWLDLFLPCRDIRWIAQQRKRKQRLGPGRSGLAPLSLRVPHHWWTRSQHPWTFLPCSRSSIALILMLGHPRWGLRLDSACWMPVALASFQFSSSAALFFFSPTLDSQ